LAADPEGLERPEEGVGEVLPLAVAAAVFLMALVAVAFAPASGAAAAAAAALAGSFLGSSFLTGSALAVGGVPPMERTFAALGLVVSAPRVRTLVPPSFWIGGLSEGGGVALAGAVC
jgi:hypothetical protein